MSLLIATVKDLVPLSLSAQERVPLAGVKSCPAVAVPAVAAYWTETGAVVAVDPLHGDRGRAGRLAGGEARQAEAEGPRLAAAPAAGVLDDHGAEHAGARAAVDLAVVAHRAERREGVGEGPGVGRLRRCRSCCRRP